MYPVRLILVSGLPGSGKSFFAEKFAAKTGAIYISSDRVRAAIHLRGKYSLSDKVSVYQKMCEQATDLLQKRKSVVVDATFHLAAMRDLFLKVAREKSVVVDCFEVWANEDLIKERLSQKRKDSEADFKVYELIKLEFEPWRTPRLRLQSMPDNISSMIEEAMGYLEEENV